MGACGYRCMYVSVAGMGVSVYGCEHVCTLVLV